jgi:hypothetical protein
MTPPPFGCPESNEDSSSQAASSYLPKAVDHLAIALESDSGALIEPEFVKNAASAVLLYFKKHLGQEDVLPADFASALEKVLAGFGYTVKATVEFQPAMPTSPPSTVLPRGLSLDLHHLVVESRIGLELMFYGRLREEMAKQLSAQPSILHWHGLRPAVKFITGAPRWNRACQELNDQVVQFLRNHFASDSQRSPGCTFLLN